MSRIPGLSRIVMVLAASLVALCAAAFIVILGITAYWDHTIRVLHVFGSLPYALAAALCHRGRKLG